MRTSMLVFIEVLEYILYKWLGVHGICFASHALVRPCSLSLAFITLPICTSRILSIKKAWKLILARVSVFHAHASHKSFHAVKLRRSITLLDALNPLKEEVWKMILKDSYKRYLIICRLYCYILFFSALVIA